MRTGSDIPATIVMPTNTPIVKVTQTEGHGATVILHGDTFDAAYAHARLLEAERGYTFVHPFDDVRVIAGQGTVAIEMLEDVPAIDTFVTPIGGGGLISGMATVAQRRQPGSRGPPDRASSAWRRSCSRRCTTG